MTDSQSYPPPPPDPSGYGPQGYGGQGYGTQPGYGVPAGGPGYAAPIPFASWIQRVGGYIVDMLVLLPGYAVIMIGAFMMPAAMTATVDANGQVTTGTNGGVTGAALGVMLIGYILIFALQIWNRYFRMGRTGWSLGKQVVGIRLVAERTGQPLGAGMAFVRDLAHVLDSLACYLGWLWPLWDQKRQTFADKLCSTVVIQQRRD